MRNTKYVHIIDSTGEFNQLLIGSYLGDGSFIKISGGVKNSRLSIAHSINQKDYAYRKWEVFNKLGIAGKISENKIYGNRYKNGFFEEVRFKTKSHPIFTDIRTDGYDNFKKKLHMPIVRDINEFGLAIWFMDDGNRTINSCEINCQKFSEEEKDYLRILLKMNFDLTVNVTKSTLYIPVNQFEKFKNLVEKYMMSSLMYKLQPYKGSV